MSVIFLSLATYVVPAFLSRQKRWNKASQFFAAGTPTSKGIFQNSSVAYAIQMATFGPFFVWGATGQFLPAILNSIFLAAGLGVLFLFRKEITSYLSRSLTSGKSITIHEYISESHGGSSAVRVAASSLTIVALTGIVMSEMYVASAFLGPVFGSDINTTYSVFIVMLLFMLLYTRLGGNEGVMRADQFQLGVAYVSLFLALAGILLVATGTPATASPTAVVGFLLIFLVVVVLLALKRFSFIDYSVSAVRNNEIFKSPIAGFVARTYGATERVLNVLAIVSALACGAAALYLLVHMGRTNVGASVVSFTHQPIATPWIELAALVVLPWVYQICDITNWQRLAAFRPEEVDNAKSIRGGLLGYAIEAPTIWVLMMLFGAAALVYPGGLSTSDPIGSFVNHLASHGLVGNLILGCLLVGIFAVALSTMDAVLSATFLAFRYDVLPFIERRKGGQPIVSDEPREIRRTSYFGILIYAVVAVLFYISEHFVKNITGNYLSILLAFYSAQTAFFPLVMVPLLFNGWKGRKPVGAGTWGALATLILSFCAAIIMTTIGLFYGGGDLFTWGAIPVAFAVGCAVCTIACFVNYFAPSTPKKIAS